MTLSIEIPQSECNSCLKVIPDAAYYCRYCSQVNSNHVDLEDLKTHVVYEIQMLCETAKLIYSNYFVNNITKNAIVESFLIHSRILYSFLYSKLNYPTDIIVEDFVERDWWHNTRSVLENSDKLNTKWNKQLAHLTYERLYFTKEDFNWFLNLADQIIDDYGTFIKQARFFKEKNLDDEIKTEISKTLMDFKNDSIHEPKSKAHINTLADNNVTQC